MNLYFRLFCILIVSRYRKKVEPFGPCRTPFRCWFTDLDILRHMNNGKYFSLMDLARIDLMKRAGLTSKLAQKGWYPVVVAETACFKKSIKLFDRFEVETKVVGWDEKAILIHQVFFRGGEIMCEAVVRGRFLRKAGGSVSVSDLLDELSIEDKKPEVESWIEEWNRGQQRRA